MHHLWCNHGLWRCKAQTHHENFCLFPCFDFIIWAEMAMLAIPLVCATTWLPKPCTWLAHATAM